MLDSQEVQRQNAMQAAEAADRAGAIVSDEIQAIMEQAEAHAEEIRRNAASDAENIRQQAAGSAERVLERIEALNGSLSELVEALRREVDGLQSGANGHRET